MMKSIFNSILSVVVVLGMMCAGFDASCASRPQALQACNQTVQVEAGIGSIVKKTIDKIHKEVKKKIERLPIIF